MIIIIPEYGNRKLTNRLIRSIPEQYHGNVWVGDDGYQLPQQPLVAGRLITWGQNMGFAENVTRMIRRIRHMHVDNFMIVNTDVEIVGDAIATLDDILNKTQGIIGPAIQVPDRITGRKRHGQLLSQAEIEKASGIETFTTVSGACLCINAWVWHRLRGFDYETFKAYYEDDDICIRAIRAGYPVRVCFDAVVKHEIGQTYCKDMPSRMAAIKASKQAFKEKHPDVKWDHTGHFAVKSVPGQ